LVAGSTLLGAMPARAATTLTLHLNAPMVGMAATSDNRGYWTVAADGGIFSFGDAHFYGSMGGKHLNAPIVAMSAGPASRGYWMVASDGGVFAFGNAHFFGSMGGRHLNSPVVGMASTPGGNGYWMVASDGGVFAFGNAHFFGSMGGRHLNSPVVGIASTPGGNGYWMVASDGAVFAFGNAHFFGSMGGRHLDAPVVSISPDPATGGYWMAASDGGVFAFHSDFDGSEGAGSLSAPVRTVISTNSGSGYWLAGETGGVFPFGAAPFEGAINGILAGSEPPVDTSGSRILAVAQSQVGQTDPYLYGPVGSGWCAYFASWVWDHAGLDIPAEPMAYEVGAWALAHGGTMLPPTAIPQVGDAVLFEPPGSSMAWPDEAGLGYPNIEHVNIVAQVLPGGGIITIGGNESGAVREQGPYSAADASSWWGQAIYGFVQPPGL
jgi:CHAP domain